MKTLYYDCFCGISGDMNLGALIDLGVDPDHLRDELKKLNIDHAFRLDIQRGMKNGISGTEVNVELLSSQRTGDAKGTGQANGQTTAHSHPDGHPHHAGHENNENNHCHDHQRSYTDIKEIINGSGLSRRVKDMSIRMFAEIARAEGKVHDRPAEQVHFHEVGAVDSIIDIVGAAVCLESLAVEQVMASSVQLGGGFVRCAHGLFPIPAPATLEILKDVPVKAGAVPFETTTPTGAAILKANVDLFSDGYTMKVKKIGYGIGKRDLSIPNVLRVYLGEHLSHH